MDSLLNDVEYQEIYETLAGTERGQAFLNTFAEKHKSDDANNLQPDDNILSEADQPAALDLDEGEEAEIAPENPDAEVEFEIAEDDSIDISMDPVSDPEGDLDIALEDDLSDVEIDQVSDQSDDIDFATDDTAPDEGEHAEDTLVAETSGDTLEDISGEDTPAEELAAENTDSDGENSDEDDAAPLDLDLLQVEAPLEAGEVVVEGDQDGVPEDMSQNAPEPDNHPSPDAEPMIDEINISAQSETEEDSEVEPLPDVSEIDGLADNDDVADDSLPDETVDENLDQDDLLAADEAEIAPAENDNDEAAMNQDLLKELTNLKTRISDLEEKITGL